MKVDDGRLVGGYCPLTGTFKLEAAGRIRGMVYGRRTRRLSEFEKPNAFLYWYTLHDCAGNCAHFRRGWAAGRTRFEDTVWLE